ncbi:hypothetical protein QOT17_019989 [Balamuthia mandrillaris]
MEDLQHAGLEALGFGRDPSSSCVSSARFWRCCAATSISSAAVPHNSEHLGRSHIGRGDDDEVDADDRHDDRHP